MRIKIKLQQELMSGKAVCVVNALVMPDEYYLNGGDDYASTCAFQLPDLLSDQKDISLSSIIEAIELSVNACIQQLDLNSFSDAIPESKL